MSSGSDDGSDDYSTMNNPQLPVTYMEIGKHLSNLRRQVFDLAEEDSESIDVRSSTTSLGNNSDIMNEMATMNTINNIDDDNNNDDGSNKLLAVSIGPTIKPLVNIVSPDPAMEEEINSYKDNTSNQISLVKAKGATPQAQLMTYAVEAQPYHSQIRSNNNNDNNTNIDMNEIKIKVKVASNNQDQQKPLETEDLGCDTTVDYEENDHVRVEDAAMTSIATNNDNINNNTKNKILFATTTAAASNSIPNILPLGKNYGPNAVIVSETGIHRSDGVPITLPPQTSRQQQILLQTLSSLLNTNSNTNDIVNANSDIHGVVNMKGNQLTSLVNDENNNNYSDNNNNNNNSNNTIMIPDIFSKVRSSLGDSIEFKDCTEGSLILNDNNNTNNNNNNNNNNNITTTNKTIIDWSGWCNINNYEIQNGNTDNNRPRVKIDNIAKMLSVVSKK